METNGFSYLFIYLDFGHLCKEAKQKQSGYEIMSTWC